MQISYREGYVGNITGDIDAKKDSIKTLIEKWTDSTDKTEGVTKWAAVVQKAAALSTNWASSGVPTKPSKTTGPGTTKLSKSMKATKPGKAGKKQII